LQALLQSEHAICIKSRCFGKRSGGCIEALRLLVLTVSEVLRLLVLTVYEVLRLVLTVRQTQTRVYAP
jgi:hypothetical protein